MEPGVLLRHSQEIANHPYAKPGQWALWTLSSCFKSIITLSPYIRLSYKRSLPSVFPTKHCMHLSSHPYAPHALPISFFFIWSPQNLVSAHYKANRYANTRIRKKQPICSSGYPVSSVKKRGHLAPIIIGGSQWHKYGTRFTGPG